MFDKLALATTIAALPFMAHAQDDAFTLPDLGYDYAALEPAIDAETMELHHNTHHQSYVNNLNSAVENGVIPADAAIEDLVANAGTYPDTIRNNAGGHWNHTFFWQIMAPGGERGEMSDALSEAIDSSFGSEDEFRTAFQDAGTSQFGSGWAWLIVNDANELEITSTPNQDNPLMDVAETQGTPILGNDVWEHAYYLRYNAGRGDYLENWWEVVNWDEVSSRYDEAMAQ